MRIIRRNREGAIARFIVYSLPVPIIISAFARELGRFYFREIIVTLFVAWLIVSATALWFDDRVFDGKRILLIWGLFSTYSACAIDSLVSPRPGTGNDFLPGAIAGGILGSFLVFPIRAMIRLIERRFRRCITPGRCDRCDYLLYGLSSDRCPECGEEIARMPGEDTLDPRDIPPL